MIVTCTENRLSLMFHSYVFILQNLYSYIHEVKFYLFFGVYGISTFVGYLMPNPLYTY